MIRQAGPEAPLAVRFLSDEYMRLGTETLRSTPAVRDAVDGITLGLLYTVASGPDGDFNYYIKVADGAVELARGDLADPDAKVRSSYHTAARLSQLQLSNQVAFLTGKVRISGDMGVLMRHNALLDLIQATLSGMDIDY